MRAILLDTSFLFAIFYARDNQHSRALLWTDWIEVRRDVALVTTRSILGEFLALCRELGRDLRPLAAEFVDARPDKSYSLTDCIAMELCRQRAITDVLTYDRDFTQEGFRAMLREDPA